MSNEPDVGLWMPFYVSDYLAKTTRLSTLHHGVYLLMLLDLWKNGPIPDDDEVLARVAGLDADAWSIARRTIQAFFMIREGVWTHDRIEEELEKARNNRKSASDKASKAASARWSSSKKASSNAPSMPQAQQEGLHMQCPSPSPSPSPVPSPVPAPTSARSRRKPSVARPAVWQPNAQHRAIAQELGLNLGDQVTRFADWADSKGATYADWDAAFRNWLRSPLQRNTRNLSKQEQGAQNEAEIQAWLNGDSSHQDDFLEGEARHVGH